MNQSHENIFVVFHLGVGIKQEVRTYAVIGHSPLGTRWSPKGDQKVQFSPYLREATRFTLDEASNLFKGIRFLRLYLTPIREAEMYELIMIIMGT